MVSAVTGLVQVRGVNLDSVRPLRRCKWRHEGWEGASRVVTEESLSRVWAQQEQQALKRE